MITHLQVEDESVQSDVGMVHLVFKVERLRDQELEREDVGGLRVGDPRRELVDRGGAVFRLGREEDAGEPFRSGVEVASGGAITIGSAPGLLLLHCVFLARAHSHDILGVVVHAGVSEVEPFEVGHGCGGDEFGVLEGAAHGCDLGQVVGHEGLLVRDGEVLDLGGRWGRRRRRCGCCCRGGGRGRFLLMPLCL